MPGQSAAQLVEDQWKRVPELAMRKLRWERMASDLNLPAGENLLAVRSDELTQCHEQDFRVSARLYIEDAPQATLHSKGGESGPSCRPERAARTLLPTISDYRENSDAKGQADLLAILPAPVSAAGPAPAFEMLGRADNRPWRRNGAVPPMFL